MQPVIVKGRGKFFIPEIGIDQTDWETGTLEQSQLSKPGHSSIIYEDVFLLWALWHLTTYLIPGKTSLQELLY